MVREFKFPSWEAYIDAWGHVRGMDYEFTYIRDEQIIRIDTDQEDFDSWSLWRLESLARDNI